jgi:hypothetical protein
MHPANSAVAIDEICNAGGTFSYGATLLFSVRSCTARSNLNEVSAVAQTYKDIYVNDMRCDPRANPDVETIDWRARHVCLEVYRRISVLSPRRTLVTVRRMVLLVSSVYPDSMDFAISPGWKPCQPFCITGFTSVATRTTSTRSSPG